MFSIFYMIVTICICHEKNNSSYDNMRTSMETQRHPSGGHHVVRQLAAAEAQTRKGGRHFAMAVGSPETGVWKAERSPVSPLLSHDSHTHVISDTVCGCVSLASSKSRDTQRAVPGQKSTLTLPSASAQPAGSGLGLRTSDADHG